MKINGAARFKAGEVGEICNEQIDRVGMVDYHLVKIDKN